MSKKLLIDARQEDETRLVLLNGNEIENFDYETSHRKPIKGNIYLARVTRVEPSLQAAFVEYGGNRQGFLAFSEIHPDYYRIPVEDREKLLAEEKALSEADDGGDHDDADADADADAESDSDSGDDDDSGENENDRDGENDAPPANGDAADDVRARRRRRANFSRHYKIQEVISNRQILLVQAVKEERGGKGAALTTYISLAGRYCVLMPNTHHRGGVSRKISNAPDRKKIKTIVSGLDVPDGMAVIVRTAGAKRTKTEIARDYNYLMNSWKEIAALTMESNAPALIHEEGNLIKRAVRDYYTADVDEIVVDGKEAYKMAKAHMKNLMPSHAKKVKEHKASATPLLQKYAVEEMLASMHEPQVLLKSGGYIVINQTEALVAIDVNSGRATRERNIEETALKTNLEAAEAVAHQLRLRDLSGLIVVDFIDMDLKRNQNAVERKLKESVKADRARIQLGSISRFGLLEMSRQRLRSSLAETVTSVCPHCEGSGRVHSVESAALFALHAIEARATGQKPKDKNKDGEAELTARMHSSSVAYLREHKSAAIDAIGEAAGVKIVLADDDTLLAPKVRFGDEEDTPPMRGGRGRRGAGRGSRRSGANGKDREERSADNAPDNDASDSPADGEEEGRGRRRRRRGKRGGRRRRRDNDADANVDGGDTQEATPMQDNAPDNAPGKIQDGANANGADATTDDAAGKSSAKKTKAAAKTKTTVKKKSAAKTKTGEAGKAKTKTKTKAKAEDKSSPAKKSASSAVNVVNVDSVAASERKSGWWSN